MKRWARTLLASVAAFLVTELFAFVENCIVDLDLDYVIICLVVFYGVFIGVGNMDDGDEAATNETENSPE